MSSNRVYLLIIAGFISIAVFFTGCIINEEAYPTTYSDNAKAYADEHFNEDVYRWHEFRVACDPRFGAYGSYPQDDDHDFNTWTEEDFRKKHDYLPNRGFTHELPTKAERDSSLRYENEYYRIIGEHINQFGFGWDDVYQKISDDSTHYIFLGDEEDTGHYDNLDDTALRYIEYMDMLW
ncbi:MAG: hypothetical protein HN356_00655 [Calditrichaeota bacterium]|nr:hypothetical protein [Calditrichota bacterium]MBT7788600.1 hypothetical protein [Calditrichota bacterium]